ncbi:MAG: N-acetylmuramoyl-L-alanine amidase [Chlorobiaceae bacterium]|nr:N-acetylmuramoyl-L-alanine amidase [Chlorobiaceae bacterium]
MSKPLYVILDNGHGQETPGKRSPVWPDGTQLFEYEFNRAIVNRVALGLTKAGIKVTRLVPELHDVSITERIIRANNIITAANRDGFQCLLVSVHANAGGGTGFEVLTSVGKTRSDELAEIFYQLAETVYLKNFPMRRDVLDGDSDKETNSVSILPKTNCPAVLTENLFMDTRKDCQLLMSDFGRDMIAEMHVKAIEEYARRYAGFNQ